MRREASPQSRELRMVSGARVSEARRRRRRRPRPATACRQKLVALLTPRASACWRWRAARRAEALGTRSSPWPQRRGALKQVALLSVFVQTKPPPYTRATTRPAAHATSPPALTAKNAVNPTHTLLKLSTPVRRIFRCSVCSSSIPKNETFYRCYACNLDLCAECKVPPPPSRSGHRFADARAHVTAEHTFLTNATQHHLLCAGGRPHYSAKSTLSTPKGR